MSSFTCTKPKLCLPFIKSGTQEDFLQDNQSNWHLNKSTKSDHKNGVTAVGEEDGHRLKDLSHNDTHCDSVFSEEEETVRKMVCYLNDDDVHSIEQLIREGFDVNKKIPLVGKARCIQDSDKHQDDFGHGTDSKTNKDRSDSIYSGGYEDFNKITVFHFCIVNKKLNILSHLSSLDQFSEDNIRAHLERCDPECRGPIMLGLKERLEKKYKDATIQLGRYHSSDVLMFLVSSESVKEERTETMAGVQVHIVNPVKKFDVSIDKREQRLDGKSVFLLQNARRAYEDELYKSHSNINVISISSINTRNTIVGTEPPFEACIVIYCSNMGFIPDGEERFPKCIEHNGVQIPIDVRDGHSIPVMRVGNYKQEGQRRIRMGYRIYRSGKNKQGSIGPFVQKHHLQVEFITSAHVLFDIGNNIGRLSLDEDKSKNEVCYGKPGENGNHTLSENVCGMLQTGFFIPDNGIDAAVVQISESCTPLEGNFRERVDEQCWNIGMEAPVSFNSGSIVSKDDIRNFIARSMKESDNPIIIGNSSIPRTSIGRLHQDGVLVSTRLKFNDVKHVMKDVYRVVSYKNPFIELGDSGSAVFVKRDNELQCIGIALSQGDNGMTGFVTPIDSVLEVLGEDFKLKTFYRSRHTIPSANKKPKFKRNQSK